MRVLFLDDRREPKDVFKEDFLNRKDVNVVVVSTYNSFVEEVEKGNGQFDIVSFDHDIGDIDKNGIERTGKDCAYYLLFYCVTNNISVPSFKIHTDNPSGINIRQMLEKYAEEVND